MAYFRPDMKGLFQHATWKVATSIKHNHAEAQVKEKKQNQTNERIIFFKEKYCWVENASKLWQR